MANDFLDFDERIRLAVKIGESLYREFKSALDGPPSNKTPRSLKNVMTDVGQTLVAFANADGGELLIGVEDDGTITGVPFVGRELEQLLQASLTHVHKDTPLPAPRKQAVSIDGRSVVYFSVSKGTQYVHLTSDGRCLRRVDRESLPFSAEKITANRLEDQSRTWDRDTAYGASLDDLDLDLVQSVASQIAYGISVEKCLQYLDLAEFTPDGLRLKKGAAMLFAKDIRKWHSGCSVRIMSIRGKEKRSGEGYNVVKDSVVSDSILKLVDSSWERLTLALSSHTQLTESARFEQTLMYPQIACREALINAIVHRNYAIEGRGIEISIFQDRMEILSPGMLLSTVSIEDIRALKSVHESRNPLIARVLREVGLIREMGEGMRRIYDVMRSNALAEPQIESDTTGFTITLYHKSLYDPNVKLWLTNFDRYRLTESQVAIMALGYAGKEFSTQDIIDRLGIVDIGQITQIVTPLRSEGLIERTRSHFQANQSAKRLRIPKREVPTFKVVESLQPALSIQSKPRIIQEETSTGEIAEHRLFLVNLSFSVSKKDLVTLLSDHCDVLGLYLPEYEGRPGRNKGFALVTVGFDGSTDDIVKRLDGLYFHNRRLHAQRQR